MLRVREGGGFLRSGMSEFIFRPKSEKIRNPSSFAGFRIFTLNDLTEASEVLSACKTYYI